MASNGHQTMSPSFSEHHYSDVRMGTIASQITSLTIVYSTVYSDADQRKHQSSASLAFVWGIHRGPVNSPHKWPVTRKMFPFDNVIMTNHPHNAKLTQSIIPHVLSNILKSRMVTQHLGPKEDVTMASTNSSL